VRRSDKHKGTIRRTLPEFCGGVMASRHFQGRHDIFGGAVTFGSENRRERKPYPAGARFSPGHPAILFAGFLMLVLAGHAPYPAGLRTGLSDHFDIVDRFTLLQVFQFLVQDGIAVEP
jgi:hypothetical protein